MIPSQRRVLEKPASVTVELTRQCNVKCIHCYSSAGIGGFNPSSGVLKSILHKALDVEPFYLIFTGGEPFVRADLPDLMSTVYGRTGQQMPEITIATNGQLISSERGEKVLDAASKINDLVGYPVIGIYVSLHGSTPEIHDRIMASSGAYARAVKGISMIKERGNIAFGVGCTPLRINYDDLDNIVNRALELGSPVLNFSQFVPTGRGAFAKEIDLTPEQYQNFVQWFVQRREELEEKILLVTHEPLEVMVYPVVSELEQYYGCPAAWLSATIEPDGTVYPCPLSPIAAGNVSETSLKDIWLNSAVFKQFRDRDNFSGVCGSCDLKWVCGGCRGTSLARFSNNPSLYYPMNVIFISSLQPRLFKIFSLSYNLLRLQAKPLFMQSRSICMDIMNYGLREKYDQLKRFGDRLSDMKTVIEWERIRPLLNDLYINNTEKGGRSNYDPILMVKILFLQSIYGIVDESIEKEIHNRLDFMNFLDYPESVPDARTIWLFRERLSNNHKDKKIWKEIWKQFKEKGITVKKGTIQDATFIESDPGHGKHRKGDGTIPIYLDQNPVKEPSESDHNEEKTSKREAKTARKIEIEQKKKAREEERKNAKTRRSKDGTWTVKNKRSHFGYKLHTIQDSDNDMILNYATTTASVHDSQIDLSIPGIVNYKDKGYFGVEGRGIDAAMDKAARGHKLPVESIRRNLRITRKRSRGERPYSVIKGIFHGGHVFVTTVPRVRVKNMFMCLGHNMICVIRMKNKGIIA